MTSQPTLFTPPPLPDKPCRTCHGKGSLGEYGAQCPSCGGTGREADRIDPKLTPWPEGF